MGNNLKLKNIFVLCVTRSGHTVMITSLTLPDTLTHVGEHVFTECESLTSIRLSHTLTHVGDSGFENCYKFTSITLPDTLTNVGHHAFKNLVLVKYTPGCV